MYDKTKDLLKSNEQLDNYVRIKKELSTYGEITVSLIGSGFAFGDIDTVYSRDSQFSLVVNQVGSVAYFMDHDEFHRWFMKSPDEIERVTSRI